MTPGDPIHGEVVSANASSAFKIATLYKAGSASAFTLSSAQFISITSVFFNSEAGGNFSFHAGATDAEGIRIIRGKVAATTSVGHHFGDTPFVCPVGVTPYLTADSGQVDITFTGTVSEA